MGSIEYEMQLRFRQEANNDQLLAVVEQSRLLYHPGPGPSIHLTLTFILSSF